MSNLRQAAQQALEALKIEQAALEYEHGKVEHIENAITALRAALAEPEQPHDLSCLCGAEWDIYSDGREELVAAPTPRKPLTEPELHAITPTWPAPGQEWGYEEVLAFVRAIERAHGIGEQT